MYYNRIFCDVICTETVAYSFLVCSPEAKVPRVTIIITSVLRSRVNEELFASKNSLVRQDNQSVAVYNLFLRAMPQLDLETPTGQVDWHYNISTPTLAYSSTIIPELPCVLFLHGNYCPQDIFEGRTLSRPERPILISLSPVLGPPVEGEFESNRCRYAYIWFHERPGNERRLHSCCCG